MAAADEYALLIDLESRVAEPLAETSLADLKLLERENLQAWVEKYPEMIGNDLMLITTEFDQWEFHERTTPTDGQRGRESRAAKHFGGSTTVMSLHRVLLSGACLRNSVSSRAECTGRISGDCPTVARCGRRLRRSKRTRSRKPLSMRLLLWLLAPPPRYVRSRHHRQLRDSQRWVVDCTGRSQISSECTTSVSLRQRRQPSRS